MAVSKERTDWAGLILRLGVGGYAILHGLGPLLHPGGGITMAHAMRLGIALLEVVCGGLVVIGVWMTPAAIALLAVIGWPLVAAWAHHAPVLHDPLGLFRFVATLAALLGGPGKLSPAK
jgi:uncharacterized membrane protein YphA (DoxX/SURF4 family)